MIGSAIDAGSDVNFDTIQPFQLDLSNVRGRAVRLGPVLNAVLSKHDYPPQVEQLVAEATIIAVLLASLLKFDGIFTLQTRGDGAITTLVADVTTAGEV